MYILAFFGPSVWDSVKIGWLGMVIERKNILAPSSEVTQAFSTYIQGTAQTSVVSTHTLECDILPLEFYQCPTL